MDKKPHISLNNTMLKFKNSSFKLFANLTINEGEKILLIGPNGSGKSSLIQIISGHIIPNKGQILFHNFNKTNKQTKPLSEFISYIISEIIIHTSEIIANLENNFQADSCLISACSNVI